MKNSIKVIIAVVAVALIGGGVYYSNTGLQQGSLRQVGTQRPVPVGGLATTTICPASPELLYDSETDNFDTIFSIMKGPTMCNYLFHGNTTNNGNITNNNEPYLSTFSCSRSEIELEEYPNSSTKRIICVKDNMAFTLSKSNDSRYTIRGSAGFSHLGGTVISKNFFSKVQVYKVSPSYRQAL